VYFGAAGKLGESRPMLVETLVAAAAFFSMQAPASEHFSSRPTDWPGCRLRHRVTYLPRLETMPASIQADFRSRVGSIAGPNEPFNPSDVIYSGDSTPSRRFLRGVQSGDYWFIWYEHGGYGLQRHVLAYSMTVNGNAHVSGEPQRAGPTDRVETTLVENMTGDPCLATDAILDGVSSSDEF
jgi:hypothetical protein